jgi:Tol biopolymer transport system component
MKMHRLITHTLLALLLAGPGFAVLASGADQRALQVDDYFAIKSVGNPNVSPDGKWVAYTVSFKDLENDRSSSRLWLVPTAGGEPRPMTAKGRSFGGAGWSPDGRYLTFTAQSQSDGWQLFGLDLQGTQGVSLACEYRTRSGQ